MNQATMLVEIEKLRKNQVEIHHLWVTLFDRISKQDRILDSILSPPKPDPKMKNLDAAMERLEATVSKLVRARGGEKPAPPRKRKIGKNVVAVSFETR